MTHKTAVTLAPCGSCSNLVLFDCGRTLWTFHIPILPRSSATPDFRCIEDSGKFIIEDVTCLVGKNESGKTAILKALHKLKSGDEQLEKFEPAKDYPKRKWRPDVNVPKEPYAIQTEWFLEDKDLVRLDEKFGKGVITDKIFRLSKGYDNTRIYDVSYDEHVLIKNLIGTSGMDKEEKKPLSDAKTVKDLQKTLSALANRSEHQEKLFKVLTENYKEGCEKAVISAIDGVLPTFLYFDQYLRLPGTVAVDALIKRKNENTLTEGDKIFIALLGLAGTTIDTVHGAKTFEEFNSALRAVSNQITDQIFKYWTQNRHLDVQMRLDTARPQDPHPFNSGSIFRTRIDNKRHRADTGFDERSSGFVWFFSFLVWFYRLRETYKENLIILLDEPGLTLHARAQADLLRYINEQLKPQYQIIYTTHSPFMIDPDSILAARTVEDVVIKDKSTGEEKLLGTKVSHDVLSTDPDTISPLQRALDYELTQTLFIGRHTILVEGSSDFLYLKWFSRQLEAQGKAGLDYRWTISIVGGVDRIPGFVSLFRGNQLEVSAVIDVQSGHKQKIENARKSLKDDHLITVNSYSGTKEADIEDVLGGEFYLALLNNLYRLQGNFKLSITDIDTSLRIVPQVEKKFAQMPVYVPEFDHFAPAQFLFEQGDEGTKYPGFVEALEKIEKLIIDLNSLLERSRK